jgi:transposase
MASEPVALINWFKSLGVRLERIGLEAGPLSQWLYGATLPSRTILPLASTTHTLELFKDTSIPG